MRVWILKIAIALTLAPALAFAQQQFSTAIQVGELAISHYEIDQRSKLLTALGTRGDTRKVAIRDLIDDRLKLIAAEELDIEISDGAVERAMVEFSQRTQLSYDELLDALLEKGVNKETLRDYIKPNQLWRQVVSRKFSGTSRVPVEDLDLAASLAPPTNFAEALMYEIFLPLTPERAEHSRSTARRIIKDSSTERQFRRFARRYSIAGSKDKGGELNWVPVSNLPPEIVPEVLTTPYGQMTRPIDLGNSIVIFWIREIRVQPLVDSKDFDVRYAKLLIPVIDLPRAEDEADLVKAGIDTCEDLVRVSMFYRERNYEERTAKISSIEPRLARELRRMDENEISVSLRETVDGKENIVLLMLCENVAKIEEQGLAQIQNFMFNQRFEAQAANYLEELRKTIIITHK